MRNSRPVRWIEEAEARQVLAAARSEASAPPRSMPQSGAPTFWASWMRRWLAAASSEPGAALNPSAEPPGC